MRAIIRFNAGILFILLLFVVSCAAPRPKAIDLSGPWELCLDSNGNIGIDNLNFDLNITLPGTLDEAGIGKENKQQPELKREVILHLQRKHEYVGKAWYRKKITVPELKTSVKAILNMERVLWKSQVYVDDQLIGDANSLSVPHQYNLTGWLTPGDHELLICIDNSRQFDLNHADMAHAYTNETQIKWNGVLGNIAIKFLPEPELMNIQLFPNEKENTITIKLEKALESSSALRFTIRDSSGKQVATENVIGRQDGIYTMQLPGGLQKWDEFSTAIYLFDVELVNNNKTIQTQTISFGLREVEANGKNLTINGKPLFLRGTLECAIFPLTGHPPVTVSEWEKLFASAKSYGLNHLRFHSWCPPKAAFEAADKLGVYLQVEAPNWNTKFGADSSSAEFIEAEANRIIKAYGNHPSFCFMSMGNELEGDFQRLNNLVLQLKDQDNRHLYTTTTFTFKNGHGKFPEPADDFFITQYTDSGWVRGQGIFDAESPNFKTDYSDAVEHLTVPLITHEIGQYSVYPNLKEIEKYTGVLNPLNFKAVKNDLQQKGLLNKADDFLMASGQLAKLLYKEEIERALKTVGISGFQLLDLHDFPGQGTALVGLLDAFWESKGIVSTDEFRTFCSEVVPLIWMEKAVYENDESIAIEIGVANHFEPLKKQSLVLELMDNKSNVLNKKEITVDEIQNGKTSKLGDALFKLEDIKEASKLTLKLSLLGTPYHNSWPVWVYPKMFESAPSNIFITRSFPDAEKALKEGKKVLLNPAIDQIKGLEGKFVPVFWSPVHFPNQPGTMGLLINPQNPAFRHFPTEFHSNWQWWDLCKQSKTYDYGPMPLTPLVSVVDNFFKNRNLTNLFEAKVYNGTLVFSAIDLCNDLDKRPVARQLRHSLIQYMQSDAFSPVEEVYFDVLRAEIFKK